MTLRSQLKLAALLALTVAQVAVGREFFVRPSVAYMNTNFQGYDSTFAPGISGGAYFGGKNQHEFSVNAYFPKFTFSDSDAGLVEYGHEKFTPVLFDYKYHAVGVDPDFKNVDFYFGGSAGFARSKLTIHATNGFVTVGGSDSDTLFSYGGSTGVIVKLAAHLDLDLGYRFIGYTKQQYVVTGIPLTGENSHMHVIYAGVGYRF